MRFLISMISLVVPMTVLFSHPVWAKNKYLGMNDEPYRIKTLDTLRRFPFVKIFETAHPPGRAYRSLGQLEMRSYSLKEVTDLLQKAAFSQGAQAIIDYKITIQLEKVFDPLTGSYRDKLSKFIAQGTAVQWL